MRISKLFLSLSLLLIVLMGCIQTSSEPEIVVTRLFASPEPLPASFDAGSGAALYQESCAACHGEQGLGDGPTASAFVCQMPAFATRSDNESLDAWFDVVRNGNGGDESCLMPPWSNRLSAAQMWQVTAYAYNLRFTADQRRAGETLLAANRQEAVSADYLRDTNWHAANPDSLIIRSLQTNSLAGYNFTDSLNEAQVREALAYIRSLAFEGGIQTVAPLAQIPTLTVPQATEDPETPAEQPAAPLPLGTEDPEAPAENATVAPEVAPQETMQLTGRVIAGTEGATLPADLTLEAQVATLGADNQPALVYEQTATVNPDGSYVFNDVPVNNRALGILQTTYAGIEQQQRFIPLPDDGSTSLIFDFTVYETTDDPANIVLQNVIMQVDAVTQEGASLTFVTYSFVNTGDRIYTGQEGVTLSIPLPANAINATLENALNTAADNIQLVEVDGRPVFQDTTPLSPDIAQQIAVGFNAPYEGEMTLEYPFPYAVENLIVYVSASRGLLLESDQLTVGESVTAENGITYRAYSLTNAPLPANSTLTYRVYDGADANPLQTVTESEDEDSFLQENTTLILGLGVLLIVAGGMFLLYDLQKTRLTARSAPAQTQSVGAPQKETLIQEIAALDDAYEAGKLSEKDYLRRREALKDDLRRLTD